MKIINCVSVIRACVLIVIDGVATVICERSMRSRVKCRSSLFREKRKGKRRMRWGKGSLVRGKRQRKRYSVSPTQNDHICTVYFTKFLCSDASLSLHILIYMMKPSPLFSSIFSYSLHSLKHYVCFREEKKSCDLTRCLKI